MSPSFALIFLLIIMSTSELACTYAAMILHDDDISITAEKISILVNAAGLTVQSYWLSLFAKLASNTDIDHLIPSLGSAAATPFQKKEEVMEESDSDEDMC